MIVTLVKSNGQQYMTVIIVWNAELGLFNLIKMNIIISIETRILSVCEIYRQIRKALNMSNLEKLQK